MFLEMILNRRALYRLSSRCFKYTNCIFYWKSELLSQEERKSKACTIRPMHTVNEYVVRELIRCIYLLQVSNQCIGLMLVYFLVK